MQTPETVSLNVIAYQDGDLWVAQCIDYDIAARATSLPSLPRAFERALAANICVNAELGRQMLEGIPPAPERYRAMFDNASMNVEPRTITKSKARSHFRVAEAEAA